MDLILVKIFATALALSEVLTQPQAVKTHFDAVADQDKVVQTLRAGCAHMRRALDIKSINVDELISTALNDQKAVSAGIKAFHCPPSALVGQIRQIEEGSVSGSS